MYGVGVSIYVITYFMILTHIAPTLKNKYYLNIVILCGCRFSSFLILSKIDCYNDIGFKINCLSSLKKAAKMLQFSTSRFVSGSKLNVGSIYYLGILENSWETLTNVKNLRKNENR